MYIISVSIAVIFWFYLVIREVIIKKRHKEFALFLGYIPAFIITANTLGVNYFSLVGLLIVIGIYWDYQNKLE